MKKQLKAFQCERSSDQQFQLQCYTAENNQFAFFRFVTSPSAQAFVRQMKARKAVEAWAESEIKFLNLLLRSAGLIALKLIKTD